MSGSFSVRRESDCLARIESRNARESTESHSSMELTATCRRRVSQIGEETSWSASVLTAACKIWAGSIA